MKIHLIRLLTGFLIMSKALGLEPPKGWEVRTQSTLMTTDSKKTRVDQHKDSTNYYLGGGKIYRSNFLLPGHVPTEPEEIQLGKETEEKLGRAIANLTENYKELLEILPKIPKKAATYSKIEVEFNTAAEGRLRVTLYASKENPIVGKPLLEDLDFLVKTLATPIYQ